MSKAYDELTGESMAPFLAAFKSDETKENYAVKLRHFLRRANMQPDELVALAKKHPAKFEVLFLGYIDSRRKEKVSPSTMLMARDAIRLLFEMNDIKDGRINWKKINRTIPRARHKGSDRPPSIEEIKKLILHVGLRLKVVILLLVSSGMRVGALSWLRWQDVVPMEANGYKFAKLTIYAGEPEEYTSFITPEAYEALLEYKRDRERHSEKIAPKSPLIAVKTDYKSIEEHSVRPIKPKVLRNYIGRVWKKIGREGQEGVVIRYDFKQVHGFRKFYKTTCERSMKSIIVEILMGHIVGVSSSYMKPSDGELAVEFAKAIPTLTIMSGAEAVTRDELELQVRREVLAFEGVEENKLDKPLDQYITEELRAEVKAKQNGTNGAGIKTIPIEELETYIQKGFDYLPNEFLEKKGKAVVRLVATR